jgi:hypothetical protein
MPEDKKPSDWVDDSMMDDPDDKKPENWVEEKRVVDEKVTGLRLMGLVAKGVAHWGLDLDLGIDDG